MLLVLTNVTIASEREVHGANEVQQSISETFVTYESSVYNISINYPSSWQVDIPSAEEIISVLQNSAGSDSNEHY
jgi:hypothetical protein